MAGSLRLGVHGIVLACVVLVAGCASGGSHRLSVVVDQQREAEQAYAANDMPRALARYQALTRALPLHTDYWFRLGNVYVRLNRPDDAVEAYRRVLQREPSHAKAWHNLGVVRLREAEAAFGQSAHDAGGIDAALQAESTRLADGLADLVSHGTAESPAGAAASSARSRGEPSVQEASP